MNILSKIMFKLIVAVIGSLLSTIIVSPSTHATDAADEHDPNTSSILLELTPICSDAASSQIFWKVINSSDITIPLKWNDLFSNHEGTFTVKPGITERQFATYYNILGPDNKIQITYQDQTLVIETNGDKNLKPCEPTTSPAPTCVDASDPANLTWTPRVGNSVINGHSVIAITTRDGAPACNDTTIFLSSYLMPDNYNGKGFGDPTSYPQTKFDASSITFTAGSTQIYVLDTAVPAACKNYQLDLYYAPEIVEVGRSGHGNQVFDSIIHTSEGDCQTTPPSCTNDCTVPHPGDDTPTTPTAPTTPTVPVTTTPVPTTPVESDHVTIAAPSQPLPAVLPSTGSDVNRGLLQAVLLGVITYVSLYALLSRKS